MAKHIHIHIHAHDAGFNESDHPRAEGGKFAVSSGGKTIGHVEKHTFSSLKRTARGGASTTQKQGWKATHSSGQLLAQKLSKKSHAEAMVHGHEARRNGKPRSENPHPIGSEESQYYGHGHAVEPAAGG